MNCPYCNAVVHSNHPYAWCLDCGKQFPKEFVQLLTITTSVKAKKEDVMIHQPKETVMTPTQFQNRLEEQMEQQKGFSSIQALRWFAFLSFLGGLIFGIIAINKLGKPLGPIVLIVSLVAGFVECIMFAVASYVVEHVIAIRVITELHFRETFCRRDESA